jgi:phenylacetaldehyde dehydrogenase
MHPDIDKVEVGKLIVQAAAGNLKKVSLELGGKSPTIVFPDANMDVAITGTSSAIFFNMGQCCTAGSRLYAHKRVFDRLMQGVADRAGKICATTPAGTTSPSAGRPLKSSRACRSIPSA